MEQFKLPFPTLKYLAGNAIVRSLVWMKADYRYWLTEHADSFKKCELRVDELPLSPVPKEYVRDVLKLFFNHLLGWVFRCLPRRPDIHVDAHGNVDERKTIRHYFEKRYKNKFYRQDFGNFVRFLEYLTWFYYIRCDDDFVNIFVNLQKVDTSIEGPNYQLVDKDMHVMFRFVNSGSVPFNALLEWKKRFEPHVRPLTISMEQKDVLVTYSVYKQHYNDEDMFRIHVDLLQPSHRLEFVKKVLDLKKQSGMAQIVIRFSNVLDPEMRRNSLSCLNERDDIHVSRLREYHSSPFSFVESFLEPQYKFRLMPMLKLVWLNLNREDTFRLFSAIVKKIDLNGFDSLLFLFWGLLSANKKSRFRSVFENYRDEWHPVIKKAMKKVSQVDMTLFQVLFDDLSADLSEEQSCRLRGIILHE